MTPEPEHPEPDPGATRTWRAPGRVNLIGEHTDYNGGFALPLAITQGCTATVTVRADRELHVVSAQVGGEASLDLDTLAPGSADGGPGYVAGVVWALIEQGATIPGLDVAVDGDVPLGSGLSSSAALICSVAGAVNDLLDLHLDDEALVAVTRRAENDFIGAPTGGMDQLASICGRAGRVLLCDMRSLQTRLVPMDLDRAGLVLLVADTRASHQHADGAYRERRESCEQAARLLGVSSLREVQDDDHEAVLARLRDLGGEQADVLVRRTRHILTENARVLDVVAQLERGDVAGIGPALTASHRSMREDFEITVEEVDVAVDAALAAGSLGARMTGGGFGGCVIALTPAAAVDAARDAIRAAFDDHGFAAPLFFTATPGPGAHQIRG